jgi:hypothetical protein
MCSPSWFAIITGSLSVVLGLTLASYAIYFGITRLNILWFIEAIGSAVFVAGIVGQRAYYLSADQVTSGCTKTVARHPGAWDASISIPVVSLHLDLISVVGFFVMVLGFCLMMFLEPQKQRTEAV